MEFKRDTYSWLHILVNCSRVPSDRRACHGAVDLKNIHDIKVEKFYLAGIFRTLSLGGSISSTPEVTALRNPGDNQVIQKFCNKGKVI